MKLISKGTDFSIRPMNLSNWYDRIHDPNSPEFEDISVDEILIAEGLLFPDERWKVGLT